MDKPKCDFRNWMARLSSFVDSLERFSVETIYEWEMKPPEAPRSTHPDHHPEHSIPVDLLQLYSVGASAFRLSYSIDLSDAPTPIGDCLEESAISSDITFFSHAELTGGVEAIYDCLYNANESDCFWGIRIEEQEQMLLSRAIPFLHFPSGYMLVLASPSVSEAPRVYHVATDTGEVKRIADSLSSFLIMWEQLLYSDWFLEGSDSEGIARRAAAFPRKAILDYLGYGVHRTDRATES